MESVPDKLRVLGTGFGRALPSHGRGHWFNPSRYHYFTLCIQRPVAVVPDCISQAFLFGTSAAHGGIFMATIRRRNGRYHAQIRRKGFSPITSTFLRLTIARRWIASIEADIENKAHIDYSEAEKTTLNDLLNRYESEILPSKKGGKVEHYRIGTLRQHLGHSLLSDLSPARIGTSVYRSSPLPL